MHFKVFMDTNIYDGAGYSFSSDLFNKLKRYAKDGILELQINSVVKGEVNKHISTNVKKAAKDVKKAFGDRSLAGIRKIKDYSDIYDRINPAIFVQDTITEFEHLLADCKVEEITLNNIDIESIISSYFKPCLPFENGKKDEFPDAIILCSIIQEIERLAGGKDFLLYKASDGSEQEMIYCIISDDKGFKAGLEHLIGDKYDEDVKIFDSLNAFITFITTQDSKAEELQKKLDCGFAYEIINESIKEIIESADYNIDELGGNVEDVNSIDTRDYQYRPFITDFREYNNGVINAKIFIEVDYTARIEYEYLNISESYWDKEDPDFYWEVYTTKVADFKAEATLSFSISINEDGKVEFLDYIEIPSTIEIGSDDIVEIISCEDRRE